MRVRIVPPCRSPCRSLPWHPPTLHPCGAWWSGCHVLQACQVVMWSGFPEFTKSNCANTNQYISLVRGLPDISPLALCRSHNLPAYRPLRDTPTPRSGGFGRHPALRTSPGPFTSPGVVLHVAILRWLAVRAPRWSLSSPQARVPWVRPRVFSWFVEFSHHLKVGIRRNFFLSAGSHVQ